MNVLSQRKVKPRRNEAASAAPQPEVRGSFWLSPTLWLSLATSLLLFLAFPPVDLPWLVWVAPVPLLWLIGQPQLPGRRPYVAIWLASLVHWLAMLEGIRRAHDALYGGWLALALYLAFYLPVFVGLTRVAVHRLKVSVVLAAPVVWVGLELVRGYVAGGFSAALLSHALANQTLMIQISDLAGAYTLSLVIMLVAACLARMLPLPLARRVSEGDGKPSHHSSTPTLQVRNAWPAAVIVIALAATLGYGRYRLTQTPPHASRPPAKVALIQGSLDTVFHMTQERVEQTFSHYRGLTDQARQREDQLDLVVWPESMFLVPERIVEEPVVMPADAQISEQEFRRRVASENVPFQELLAGEAARVNTLAGRQAERPTKLLIGTTTAAYGPAIPKTYNAAVLADPTGNIVGRYCKMEAVMFGEYIPLADVFPWIYRLTPMAAGMSVGDRPQVFEVGGLRMSPSICFESVIPHLIRSHVVTLSRQGTPPDALVNITNDGWFWGSAILDHHFRCAVFRAVENRKPIIIAANTGLSASIDGNGVVQKVGNRRTPEVIIAEVRPDGRTSPYSSVGDLPAWLCAVCCAALAVLGWRKRR
jgi:apolipoprotein N-acyltransferase